MKLTANHVQSAKYANELLSHGIRNYAAGFLVEETSITLWYADRMGLSKSQSFDFFKNPELFLLVLAALHFGSRHKLGINPLIEYPPDALQTHDGAILKLPHARDISGKKLDETLTFQLRVSEEHPLSVAYGALGRGTTVIPIKAEGRAEELFGSDDLVAKLAWQPLNRCNTEDGLIRVIRKKLSEHDEGRLCLKNITDLKCSLDMSDAELGLPRAFMGLPEPYEPRLFRALIVKEYIPLEHARSPEEFKIIFIDVVKGMWKTFLRFSFVDAKLLFSPSLGIRGRSYHTS